MQDYTKDLRREKKLTKKVRKQFKQWKIGRWIVLVLAFGLIAGLIYLGYFLQDETDLGMILFTIGAIPISFIISIYAVSISGGRDILMARVGEKVYLEDTELINVFAPKSHRFRIPNHSHFSLSQLEYRVPYDKIHEMNWNKDFCRLEIKADFTLKAISWNGKDVIEKEKTNETVILYDYFHSMSELMDNLENKTNKKIMGRE